MARKSGKKVWERMESHLPYSDLAIITFFLVGLLVLSILFGSIYSEIRYLDGKFEVRQEWIDWMESQLQLYREKVPVPLGQESLF